MLGDRPAWPAPALLLEWQPSLTEWQGRVVRPVVDEQTQTRLRRAGMKGARRGTRALRRHSFALTLGDQVRRSKRRLAGRSDEARTAGALVTAHVPGVEPRRPRCRRGRSRRSLAFVRARALSHLRPLDPLLQPPPTHTGIGGQVPAARVRSLTGMTVRRVRQPRVVSWEVQPGRFRDHAEQRATRHVLGHRLCPLRTAQPSGHWRSGCRG
jgi:hypothetical protein